jgi:hypothetical protein
VYCVFVIAFNDVGVNGGGGVGGSEWADDCEACPRPVAGRFRAVGKFRRTGDEMSSFEILVRRSFESGVFFKLRNGVRIFCADHPRDLRFGRSGVTSAPSAAAAAVLALDFAMAFSRPLTMLYCTWAVIVGCNGNIVGGSYRNGRGASRRVVGGGWVVLVTVHEKESGGTYEVKLNQAHLE